MADMLLDIGGRNGVPIDSIVGTTGTGKGTGDDIIADDTIDGNAEAGEQVTIGVVAGVEVNAQPSAKGA